jgi:hypothetical protein
MVEFQGQENKSHIRKNKNKTKKKQIHNPTILQCGSSIRNVDDARYPILPGHYGTMGYEAPHLCDQAANQREVRSPANVSTRHNKDVPSLQSKPSIIMITAHHEFSSSVTFKRSFILL